MSAPRPNSPVSQDRSVNTTGLRLLQTETRHQLKTEQFLPPNKYLEEKNISKRRISKRRILLQINWSELRGTTSLLQRKQNIFNQLSLRGDFRNPVTKSPKMANQVSISSQTSLGFSILILCYFDQFPTCRIEPTPHPLPPLLKVNLPEPPLVRTV